jgi:hypothetical protein
MRDLNLLGKVLKLGERDGFIGLIEVRHSRRAVNLDGRIARIFIRTWYGFRVSDIAKNEDHNFTIGESVYFDGETETNNAGQSKRIAKNVRRSRYL